MCLTSNPYKKHVWDMITRSLCIKSIFTIIHTFSCRWQHFGYGLHCSGHMQNKCWTRTLFYHVTKQWRQTLLLHELENAQRHDGANATQSKHAKNSDKCTNSLPCNMCNNLAMQANTLTRKHDKHTSKLAIKQTYTHRSTHTQTNKLANPRSVQTHKHANTKAHTNTPTQNWTQEQRKHMHTQAMELQDVPHNWCVTILLNNTSGTPSM